PKPTGRNVAAMAFDDPILDFGKVWDVDELVGEFAFTNNGGKALVISEIKPSCGCTTTELDRMRFEPGEGSSIRVVWKPKGFGSQAKTITVHSNGEGPGIDMLTIRAEIQPFAKFAENPVRLGIVREGTGYKKLVHLSCEDPDFELLEVLSGSRFLTATDMGRQANGSQQIEIAFVPETPWGKQTCSVQARIRARVEGHDEPVEHTAVLSVSADFFGELRVEPTLFAVGYVPLKGTFERSVRLLHVNNQPFLVTKAEVLDSRPPGMQILIEPYTKGYQPGVMLKLKGNAHDYEGLVRGTVRFETNIPGEMARTIPIMGIVRK
ncbi:MAG: hypothetical protein ACI9F9_001287, partial [Candidatus Paceibacteria bacterium]